MNETPIASSASGAPGEVAHSAASPHRATASPPRATGFGWAVRLRAAAIHFALCLASFSLVLYVVFALWYPAPLDRVVGVGPVLWLLLAVDACLGPLLTFVVYDRRKPSLRRDLATIALIQLAALVYGVHTIEAGRPHFLVWVVDRFEVVSIADLDAAGRAELAASPAAATSWRGPAYVAAVAPADPARRSAILFEAIDSGRDVQHHPSLYQPLRAQKDALVAHAKPLDALPSSDDAVRAGLDGLVQRAGVAAGSLAWVPLKGPAADAVVVIDRDSADVVGIVPGLPWR